MSRTVIANSERDGLLQTIRIGQHRLQSDEPPDSGNDGGPDPYELLLAALGACTSMTLRMYADRKQWPLQGVQVRLGHSRIYAEDCAACETREGMLDQIDVEISLIGDLSESQRQRLMEIANHCPVHRTLLGEIQIRMSLSAPGVSTDKQLPQDEQQTSA
jgi:putative redox protein